MNGDRWFTAFTVLLLSGLLTCAVTLLICAATLWVLVTK